MKKRTFAVAALAIAALTSCLKNDGSTSVARAGILVDLLSPDATNTTVILNGNTIGSNVSFGAVPNYYNQVVPGQANVSIFSGTSTQLLSKDFNTVSGNFYSLFVVDSATKMKAIVVTDSVSYPNSADTAKVRFYNFAPNTPPLNVGINDSIILWNSRSFEDQNSADTYNNFLQMKAGTYKFQIFNPFSVTAIRDTTITLEGKHIYTVFIKGFYSDTSGTTKLGIGVVKHG